MNNKWVDPVFQEFLEKEFDVIDIIEIKEFDQNPLILASRLAQTKKEVFTERDRYIIVFSDTDYFWEGKSLLLYNLFEIWACLDIPYYTMFIITNHFGLTSYIEAITEKNHSKDRPMVFETFVNVLNYNLDAYDPRDPQIDQITHHTLCLMAGTPRSHRFATYANIKDIGEKKLVMSISSCDSQSF
jgi:hypothetical protein